MSPADKLVRHVVIVNGRERPHESEFTTLRDRDAQRGERGSHSAARSVVSSGTTRMSSRWSEVKEGSRVFSWRSLGIPQACHSLQG